ncbi:hypothetical protein K502DRAFT_368900, partial [Neoconidiobolus thromboides FSU 785]
MSLKINLLAILYLVIQISYINSSISGVIECNSTNENDYFSNIKPTTNGSKAKLGNISGFSIEYFSTYKIIKDNINQRTYVLYCAGTKVPVIEADICFSLPLTKVTVKDTARPAVAWLEMLGLRDVITSILGETEKITSPCVSKNIKEGKITKVDKQPSDSQLLFIKNSRDTYEEGNIVVPLNFYNEEYGPLQKAQWIMFIAAFFNKEIVAENIYDAIKKSADCHTHNLSKLQYHRYISFTSYEANKSGGKWSMPRSTYLTSLSQMSGSILNWQVTPNNEFQGQERIGDFQDVIGVSGMVVDIDNEDRKRSINKTKNIKDERELSNTYNEWFKRAGYKADQTNDWPYFLKAQKVFNLDGRLNQHGYSDWFETAVTRPDLVIQDFTIAQYSKYPTSGSAIWLLNLSEGKLSYLYDDDNCNTSKTTFEPSQCTIAPNGYLSFDEPDPSSGLIFGNGNLDANKGLSVGIKLAISIVVIAAVLTIAYILFRRYKKRLPPKVTHSIISRFPSINKSTYSTQNSQPSSSKQDKFYLLDSANNSFASSKLHPNHPLAGHLNIDDYSDDDLELGKQQKFTYTLDSGFRN